MRHRTSFQIGMGRMMLVILPVDLSQLRGPGKILGHVVEHEGKLGESLHARVHQFLITKILVLLKSILCQRNLVGKCFSDKTWATKASG